MFVLNEPLNYNLVIIVQWCMKKSLKEIAIGLRLTGMSYSQIKERVKVSKSTLSNWLEKYPLSESRMRELRDFNTKRIENCRKTKLRKRQEKLILIYKDASRSLGTLSKRELFIAGLFLYWGEGTKAARDVVALTNTDPSMIKFFIKWLQIIGVNKKDLRVKLHLYSDMDVEDKTNFWSKTLKIPLTNFRKPYIKDSKFSSLTYKNSFGHGTCMVSYGNSNIHNKIIMSLKFIRDCMDGKYKLV